MTKTRTLSVPVEDFDDFVEWICFQGLMIIRTQLTADERYYKTTFAYAR